MGNAKLNSQDFYSFISLHQCASFPAPSWVYSEGGKFEVPRNLLEWLGLKNNFPVRFKVGGGWLGGSHVTLLGKGRVLGEICAS